MQETFLGWFRGAKYVIQYEADFIVLARYAPQLVNTPEYKCYRFLRELQDI
ncbi:hypothetical protein MA16_Dca019460 [Dendrobium catenatum]|uniref:Uncharacterized protein n=1 Tax=Dendrobium catenatum TaxID=906689 RepID=A0A2I0WHH2_9ASPA|nr:hypothetical protein MA16_Dca019460 [Dendrobium catenatum]